MCIGGMPKQKSTCSTVLKRPFIKREKCNSIDYGVVVGLKEIYTSALATQIAKGKGKKSKSKEQSSKA